MFATLMKLMQEKKILPKISDTERQALEAGTVWIDGDFFSGNPDFKKMLKQPYHDLTEEEQQFLDGPVEELCRRIDVDTVAKSRQVPETLVQFLKEQGFMGLLIPKKYGGLEFSSLAISAVVQKVMPRSAIVGVMIIIPNSLGAAELLVHYGTKEQKDHYLPKLAKGEYIPCFALTETMAGSDAASMHAEGVLYKDTEGETHIRLHFEKRYISMAPVSNLISLACKLKDPENLLGKGKDVGITVLLVPKNTPGVQIGHHHIPLGDSFYNGPIWGENVIVGLNQIIGGTEYAGKGWKMLMEQLGGGRAISLPAGALGGMKNVCAAAGAYSQVRSQFNIPIGKMEGIIEKLAKIASMTYAYDALRIFACSAVDEGQQPPVISAVLKAYSTEVARQLIIDAMDIFAGAGIMQGPRNILARGYAAAPIGITVEGANIMTRTLIIFGQGATRCHPHAFNLIQSVSQKNVKGFRKHLLFWLGSFVLGIGRSAIRTLTRGWVVLPPNKGPTATYYRRIGWAASRFSLLTNLAIFTLGGKLKVRGSLTGRFADALAWQLIAISSLRRFEAEGRKTEDLPLVQYACEYALYEVQKAFEGIYLNFDAPVLGIWMRGAGSWLLRLNPVGSSPSDRLSAKAAKTIQKNSEQFERLVKGIYFPDESEEGLGHLLFAFKRIWETREIIKKIQDAQKKGDFPRGIPDEKVEEAEAAGIITRDEAKQLNELHAAKRDAITVDSFSPSEFFGDETIHIAPGFAAQEVNS